MKHTMRRALALMIALLHMLPTNALTIASASDEFGEEETMVFETAEDAASLEIEDA